MNYSCMFILSHASLIQESSIWQASAIWNATGKLSPRITKMQVTRAMSESTSFLYF